MKTIKNTSTNEIRRVTDNNAKMFVRLGQWVYIPKEVWKTQVRDKPKDKPEE